MRVLIIEDNEFNAFCLRRLLESALPDGNISIANNSNAALSLFYAHPFDLVILDGDLGAARANGAYCNGPELAQLLLSKYPQIALVAWTDSQLMRQEFSLVFKQFQRQLNELSLWNKTVTTESIYKTWRHHFGELLGEPSVLYSRHPQNNSAYLCR